MLLIALALSSASAGEGRPPMMNPGISRESIQSGSQRLDGHRPPMGNRMDGPRPNPVDRLLAEGDTNKDGQLSRDELNKLRARMQQFRQERREFRQEHRQQGLPGKTRPQGFNPGNE